MSDIEYKELGNQAFKEKKFTEAIEFYSKALNITNDKSTKEALHSNKAAVYIKMGEFKEALAEANAALEINSANPKALYRSALATFKLGDAKNAFQNLQKLVQIEPKNADANSLLFEVRKSLSQERGSSSAIGDILHAIAKKEKEFSLEQAMSGIIGLCADDRSHAMDFGRRAGLSWVNDQLVELFGKSHQSSESNLIVHKALRCIGSACSHADFVTAFVDVNGSPVEGSIILTSESKLSFQALCDVFLSNSLQQSSVTAAVSQSSVSVLVQILKFLPLTEDDRRVADDDSMALYLSESTVRTFVRGLSMAIQSGEPELFSIASEALTAFLSESAHFLDVEKIFDTRLESMEERKRRHHTERMLKKRAKCHGKWALQENLLYCLMETADCENSLLRQRSAVGIARLVNAVDDDEFTKPFISGYITITDNLTANCAPIVVPSPIPPFASVTRHPIELMRRRATLEAALLSSSHADLAVWALDQMQGIDQLAKLVESAQDRCQEVASEVFCLAASSETGCPLLSAAVVSGTLQTLLKHGTSSGVRAAAAATITKLSLRAKALEDDETDLTSILNTVVEVLKTSPLSTLKQNKAGKIEKPRATNLVSFSKLDNFDTKTSQADSTNQTKQANTERLRIHSGTSTEQTGATSDFTASLGDTKGGASIISTERAIEVLAAVVGKTRLKEEIVHGSHRVSSAVLALLALDLDMRSTAAYGLAHILASLTVSNHELRARALAERDMTPEQYEKLMELQRLKAEDEQGNLIEERKEPTDPDTDILCHRRIQKIVNAGGISVLAKLITNASNQAREAAARALRQICVDEKSGARGLMIQHGGLKACISVALEADCPKNIRIDCAHALAKALVTTNPHLLPDHARLGAIPALIYLCREGDATCLAQFEALMALANLVTVGPAEQDRLAKDRGVSAVHFLMFSDHKHVRRAATEVLLNMATHDGVLQLLRKPDQVRLWLGLAEEFDKDVRDLYEDEDEQSIAPVAPVPPVEVEVEEEIEEVVSDSVRALGSESRPKPEPPKPAPVVAKKTTKNLDEIRRLIVDTEPYKTARASCGTLASVAGDLELTKALLKDGCAESFYNVLSSQLPELVHRVLVIMNDMARCDCAGVGQHFLDGGLVPAIALITRMGEPMLADIARDTATAISQAISRDNSAKTQSVAPDNSNIENKPNNSVAASSIEID